jgi:hypothetical protein
MIITLKMESNRLLDRSLKLELKVATIESGITAVTEAWLGPARITQQGWS